MKKTALLLFIFVLACFEGALYALDITVTSNQDPAEAGKVTLREAIVLVNNSADAINRISFNLGGADQVIFLNALEGFLPSITSRVIIDGIDKFSQQMVFIDGSNLLGGTEIALAASGLHLSDSGVGSGAADSVIRSIGIQNFKNLSPFTNGILIDGLATNCTVSGCVIQSLSSSLGVFGINVQTDVGFITNNSIKDCDSLDASAGILYSSIDVNGSCSGNTVEDIRGSSVVGIAVSGGTINGNCTNNTISYIEGNGIATGIGITNLNGNCSNNSVSHVSGSTIVIGILITSIASQKQIICNHIDLITVNMGTGDLFGAEGIFVGNGNDVTITRNSINNISSVLGNADAVGILMISVDNSLVTNNILSNITGPNNNGSGIFLFSQSTGNDILSNSIFNINGKAINILDDGGLTDARVVLTSAVCADGCKIIVDGLVIPNPQLSNADNFLLQFFVSPNNNPSEAKTLIGECTHNVLLDNNFSVKLSTAVPIQFGQFITANATALLDGTQENLNTSEVSNAIPSCETFSAFCECPKPQPEPELCPAVNCNGFLL